MVRPRITLVGGGSFNWCPKLIRDVLLTGELEDAEIRLLDPNREAASIIEAVGRRYASEWKLPASFSTTTKPERAFEGADFVIITISTGGLEATAHDIKIPERFGIYQTVGDTVGPGGWARGLRNIPVFVKFAKQIGKHAPDAVILNYTNPLTTLTKTLSLLTSQPVVGLCHGLFENFRTLADIFKVEEEEISARYAGMNHFFWFLEFAVKGKPGLPMLRRKLRKGERLDDLISKVYTDPAGHTSVHRLVASELFEEFGYLPYLGDRHICEFFSRYLAPTEDKLASYHLHRTSIAERRANNRRARRYALDLGSGKFPLQKVRSRETAADIMSAWWSRRDFIDVMNLPNIGQVANLPAGAVVETPGVVTRLGFTPLACGALPEKLVRLVMPHVINQQLTVEAALEGDWSKAYQALIGDPLCSHLSIPRIKEMGRRLLEANRRYLGQLFRRAPKQARLRRPSNRARGS